MIILYNSNSKSVYFEYIEEIFKRLYAEKEDDEWKNQKYVNIHIPVKNVFDHNICTEIYQRINNRYNYVESLINTCGIEIKIPIFGKEQQDKINFEDLSELAESLKKHGSMLINSLEFSILYDLISALPISTINSSKELLFLSAITFSEMGKTIDANYYVNKCLNKESDYSAEELNTLTFCKIKIDFSFGKLNNESFLNQLEELKKKTNNITNSLVIEMNILYAKVTSLFSGKLELNKELENELLDYFKKINESEIEKD